MNETKNHDVDNEKVETTKKKRASSTVSFIRNLIIYDLFHRRVIV